MTQRYRVHNLSGAVSISELETWLNSCAGRLVSFEYRAGRPRVFNEFGPRDSDPGIYYAVFDEERL